MTSITKEDLYLYNRIFSDFQGMSKKPKMYILKQLLNNDMNINFNNIEWVDKSKSVKDFKETGFYIRNTSRINEDGTIKEEVFKGLYKKFLEVKKISCKINVEEGLNIDDNDNDDEINIEAIDKDVYRIEQHHNISHIYEAMYRSEGNCAFKYDFKNSTLSKSLPDNNLNQLQRFEIKINSKLSKFEMYAKLHYRCENPNCRQDTYKSMNDVESTNLKTKCRHMMLSSGGDPRPCNSTLSNPTQLSKTATIYIYDATIVNKDGTPESILVYSMEEFKPYIYDCVGLTLQDEGESYLFILDCEAAKTNLLPIETESQIEQQRKKYPRLFNNYINKEFKIRDKDAEDIVPDWISFFDENIKMLSGEAVLGMLDVKFALMIQKLNHIMNDFYINYNLNNNIAVVGDQAVGKSWTIEHYGYLFYGGTFKATAGLNTSIPALRGSSKSNREIKKGDKNIPGLLSRHSCILIDEINQNPTLMPGLKPVLNKPTFSDDKADGNKIEQMRTAHINVTENIPMEYLRIVQGMVAKCYEEMICNPTIDTADYPDKFNYDWDVFQHLSYYKNPILKEAVRIIRKQRHNANENFLDGHDYATHDRFPFWFVIKLHKKDSDIMWQRNMQAIDRVLDAKKKRNQIATNKLMQSLSCDNVNDLFLKLKKFVLKDVSKEEKLKLDSIIRKYAYVEKVTDRLFNTCSVVLNCSRIFNLRSELSDVDYNYVKRFLYMKDRVCYLNEFDDMSTFDVGNEEIDADEVEEQTKDFDDSKIFDDVNDFDEAGFE